MPPTQPLPAPLLDWVELPESERSSRLASAREPLDTLLALGDHCERAATIEVSTALAAVDLVIADADRAGLAASKPRLLRAKVMALAYAGRLAEALETAEASESIARTLERPIDAARAQIASLHPLTKLGRIDDAVRIGTEARAALAALGEPALAARADINLGNIHKAAGRPHESAEHLERARIALTGEPRMLAHIENTLGEVHYLRDDIEASRAAFEAALGHFTDCKEPFAAAIVEGNLADLAAREGNLQRALAHFERARRVLERDSAPGHAARLAAEEAEVLASLGAPLEAEATLEHCLGWLEEKGFAIEAGRARLARAWARARLGRLDAAREDLDRVLALATERHHARLAHRARLLACELALVSEEHDRAHDEAAALLASGDLPRIDRLMATHHLAVAAARRGSAGDAIERVSEAIEIARTLGLAPLASDLFLARALLAHSTAAAVPDLEAAVEEIERIRSSIRAERLRAAWLGSRTCAYERLALARLAEGTPESLDAAFDAVERSKSRALLDLVQHAVDRCTPPMDTARGDDETRLAAELEQLRRRLNALYARWDDEGSLGERRATLPTGAVAAEIRANESALQRVTTRLAALQGERSVLAEPLRASDVRSRLAEGTVLIEYFVAEGELLAFVVSREAIRGCIRLGPERRVAAVVERMLFAMRRATRADARGQTLPPGAEDMPELRELALLLLTPLEAAIAGATHIVVIPHGVLHGVPFHALRQGRHHLIDRATVTVSPSAALSVARGRGGRVTSDVTRAPLIVGVPDRAAPSIAAEVDALTALWPTATVLRDDDATADAFLERAPQASLLHLACHGRFAESMPLASGLKLRDRWVSLREILSLRLEAQLVILAGCDTGRAAIEPGDEQVGLARSFLAAGARGVIVSRWPVGDRAAAAFMIELHTRLVANPVSTTEAVRDAARALRDAPLPTGDPSARRTNHPALWGAFGLVG
jgi:CHAT domain-containing protein